MGWGYTLLVYHPEVIPSSSQGQTGEAYGNTHFLPYLTFLLRQIDRARPLCRV